MKRIAKKHPLAIRWFHWINFPVLALMVWSGFMIYWANGVYKIGFGNTTLYVLYTIISGEWRYLLPGGRHSAMPGR